MNNPLETWYELVEEGDPAALDDLLAADAVFHSPVVHTPQTGKPLVKMYLTAAFQVLGADNFTYVRELVSGNEAALEFLVEVDGVEVNGVDLIRWNEEGQIVDFKVMLRPLKAIDLVHRRMREFLESAKAQASASSAEHRQE